MKDIETKLEKENEKTDSILQALVNKATKRLGEVRHVLKK
jgi:hypothetical protein